MISKDTYIITAVKLLSNGESITHKKAAFHEDLKEMWEHTFTSEGFLVSCMTSCHPQHSILDSASSRA